MDYYRGLRLRDEGFFYIARQRLNPKVIRMDDEAETEELRFRCVDEDQV
jgi:hypothetical protein